MPKSADFQKILTRFISQYGEVKGQAHYSAWVSEHKYDDTKPLSGQKKKKEGKEFCTVRGVEIKESEQEFHVEGLIATTHVDRYDEEAMAAGIPDMIAKETLDVWCTAINQGLNPLEGTTDGMRVGIHHSEGRTENPEYFGVVDYKDNPSRVVELPDGQYGLLADVKLLKNDPATSQIISQFQSGDLNSFSITYDTQGMQTVDFDIVDDRLVRVLNPSTPLLAFTAASNPVNPQAIVASYGFKEFKEFMVKSATQEPSMVPETKTITEDIMAPIEANTADFSAREAAFAKREAEFEAKEKMAAIEAKHKAELLEAKEAARKEAVEQYTQSAEFKAMLGKLVSNAPANNADAVAPELKAFMHAIEKKELAVEAGFRAAARLAESYGLLKSDGTYKATKAAEMKAFKNVEFNGRNIEVKGLSIGSNANTYTQSQAELDDVYDPMIWNLLNQSTVLWNYLEKDDYSNKGNNQVQFRVKTAINPTVGFYAGNEITTGKATRAKYQTQFKKVKAGIEIDGDMLAAARGSSVGDVWNVEIQSATEDLLSLMNQVLFTENGTETEVKPIGLPYITHSAANTTLYGVARTFANGLSPNAAGDTYIDGSAGFNLPLARKGITYCKKDGSNKADLFFVCDPTVGDIIRGSQDTKQRYNAPTMTRFGFETDLFIDGVPVLEDKDCVDTDLYVVDKRHFRVAVWVPPTLELLGKRSDSNEGYIKCYYATYSTSPRKMVQFYNVSGVASET